jgi:lipopolysaccharide transport system permease protein
VSGATHRYGARRQLQVVRELMRQERGSRSRGSLLGRFGGLLLPLLQTGVFTLLFGVLLRVRGTPSGYLTFALTGIVAWRVYARALSSAASSLRRSAGLLQSFPLPVHAVAAASVGAAFQDALIAAPIVAAAVLLLGHGTMEPSALLLWGAVALALHALVALGAGLLLAVAGAYFSDVGRAMSPLLGVLLFASPVVYPRSAVPARWQTFYLANPITSAIESYRAALLGAAPVPAAGLAAAFAVALALLAGGFALARWSDQRVRDVL